MRLWPPGRRPTFGARLPNRLRIVEHGAEGSDRRIIDERIDAAMLCDGVIDHTCDVVRLRDIRLALPIQQ